MDQNLLRGYEDSLYRLDAEFHIAGRLAALPGRVLRTRRNSLQRPHEFAREYFRRAGFEHVAYMLEWNHDWALASALVERWRPESHTFHLPCGEMTITLEDVAYQLGLAMEGEPVSGCMTGWETFYEGRTMEDLCQQLLGAVPGAVLRVCPVLRHNPHLFSAVSSLSSMLFRIRVETGRGLAPLMFASTNGGHCIS
ncbi:hypothetical protein PIB30_116999 [Stylosanthes scabra]|uniref:Aminotransferase-like plant mobile domain-containing protein n=1 Tax=Stylosanthes scabra TaxID=79078 RepID=A0ABU6WRA8_9FABA|nr:hypothetical protein [Stylosanthes scabra]